MRQACPLKVFHLPFDEVAVPLGGGHLPFNEAAMPFGGFHLPVKLGAEQLTGRLHSYAVMEDATCVSECC